MASNRELTLFDKVAEKLVDAPLRFVSGQYENDWDFHLNVDVSVGKGTKIIVPEHLKSLSKDSDVLFPSSVKSIESPKEAPSTVTIAGMTFKYADRAVTQSDTEYVQGDTDSAYESVIESEDEPEITRRCELAYSHQVHPIDATDSILSEAARSHSEAGLKRKSHLHDASDAHVASGASMLSPQMALNPGSSSEQDNASTLRLHSSSPEINDSNLSSSNLLHAEERFHRNTRASYKNDYSARDMHRTPSRMSVRVSPSAQVMGQQSLPRIARASIPCRDTPVSARELRPTSRSFSHVRRGTRSEMLGPGQGSYSQRSRDSRRQTADYAGSESRRVTTDLRDDRDEQFGRPRRVSIYQTNLPQIGHCTPNHIQAEDCVNGDANRGETASGGSFPAGSRQEGRDSILNASAALTPGKRRSIVTSNRSLPIYYASSASSLSEQTMRTSFLSAPRHRPPSTNCALQTPFMSQDVEPSASERRAARRRSSAALMRRSSSPTPISCLGFPNATQGDNGVIKCEVNGIHFELVIQNGVEDEEGVKGVQCTAADIDADMDILFASLPIPCDMSPPKKKVDFAMQFNGVTDSPTPSILALDEDAMTRNSQLARELANTGTESSMDKSVGEDETKDNPSNHAEAEKGLCSSLGTPPQPKNQQTVEELPINNGASETPIRQQSHQVVSPDKTPEASKQSRLCDSQGAAGIQEGPAEELNASTTPMMSSLGHETSQVEEEAAHAEQIRTKGNDATHFESHPSRETSEQRGLKAGRTSISRGEEECQQRNREDSPDNSKSEELKFKNAMETDDHEHNGNKASAPSQCYVCIKCARSTRREDAVVVEEPITPVAHQAASSHVVEVIEVHGDDPSPLRSTGKRMGRSSSYRDPSLNKVNVDVQVFEDAGNMERNPYEDNDTMNINEVPHDYDEEDNGNYEEFADNQDDRDNHGRTQEDPAHEYQHVEDDNTEDGDRNQRKVRSEDVHELNCPIPSGPNPSSPEPHAAESPVPPSVSNEPAEPSDHGSGREGHEPKRQRTTRKTRSRSTASSSQNHRKRGLPIRELRNLGVKLVPVEANLSDDDADGPQPRRSKRRKFPPLQYWKNEKKVYERRKSQILPTVSRVVVAVEAESDDGSDYTMRRIKARKVIMSRR